MNSLQHFGIVFLKNYLKFLMFLTDHCHQLKTNFATKLLSLKDVLGCTSLLLFFAVIDQEVSAYTKHLGANHLSELTSQTGQFVTTMWLFKDLFIQVNQKAAYCFKNDQSGQLFR